MVRKAVTDFTGITVGVLLMTLSLNMFLTPNNIAPGGVSGLAIIIHSYTGWPVGALTLAFNIPLFIVSILLLGAHFGIKTFYATFLLGATIDLMSFLPVLTHDDLLAGVYGGILMGVGLGLVFKYNATTGGTDLAAAILRKFFPQVSIGMLLLILDAMIIGLAGFAFSAELALYALIADAIAIRVIDIIQEGANENRAAYVISDLSDDIEAEILTKLGRGVTSFPGRGGYTGKERKVLFCVISRSEITRFKDIIREIDPDAFVVIFQAHEIMGEGFKKM
ncbi:MAG: YitT family protein [Thermoanaerobacteraceae bacterium]|nr:YitT family protein [Thermoanaerobacteraceae bacterium]